MMIAVTGGIGAGKSTVLKQFQLCGASVADADDVAHSCYEPGTCGYQRMVDHWGREILLETGMISRPAVSRIVFQDPEERKWLESLIHPLVIQEIQRRSEEAWNQRGEMLYCAIPLLYECGWGEKKVWEGGPSAVVAVWCSSKTQHQRLLARGWSEEEIKGRLAAQLTMDQKLERADYGIVTDCSWEQLAEQCRLIHQKISMQGDR